MSFPEALVTGLVALLATLAWLQSLRWVGEWWVGRRRTNRRGTAR